MLNFFGSKTYIDIQLGELYRSRGRWRGTIDIGHHDAVPLAISGGWRGPDPEALAAARQLAATFHEHLTVIADALYGHYEQAAAHFAGTPLATITSSETALGFANLHSVAVSPLDGEMTVEYVYMVDWDDEHLLGARFQGDRLVDFCGSTVPA
ncbi:MAG: hypothetical protein JO218_15220 [Burkholderiales bacterium]|nr:hypothetical protein [Burkholderiales bacterium]